MRKHLTYANVVSTICLFVVLGGTSVATVTLTRGSVKGKHIARNAVTSAKVKNRSLRARDFARASLPAGPAGSAGERGAQGEQGPPGAPGTVDGGRLGRAGAGLRPRQGPGRPPVRDRGELRTPGARRASPARPARAGRGCPRASATWRSCPPWRRSARA